MLQFATGISASQVPALVGAAVVDWRGFTEADLLGETLGSSDAMQPFDAAVFQEWVDDSPEAMNTIALAVVDLVQANTDRQARAAKN